MNPVVGLDVKKRGNQVKGFLDQSKQYRKSFSMKHIKEDFEPHKIREIKLLDLRDLSRQQEGVSNIYGG